MKQILFKGVLFIILITSVLDIFAQQPTGIIYDDNVQVRKVPNFKSIKVSSAIDLYLTQSNSTKVAVSATNEEIRDHIITEVQDGTLIISMGNNGNWMSWKKWGNYKTKAYVSVDELYSITATGAADIHIVNTLEQPKLRINLTGASDVKGEVQLGTLSISCTGASAMELSGKVEDLVVKMTGASDAKLYGLSVKGADINSTGASNVQVNVSELLKVRATGASNVYYKGSPTKDINTTGASNVKRRDD